MNQMVYEVYIGNLKYLTLASSPEEALEKTKKYRQSRNHDGSFPDVTGVKLLGEIDF